MIPQMWEYPFHSGIQKFPIRRTGIILGPDFHGLGEQLLEIKFWFKVWHIGSFV